MAMFSYWAYILIGDNETGKTTFQKHLLWYLCGKRRTRLAATRERITHPRTPKGLETVFLENRSFQEKRPTYGSVARYFQSHFKGGDISVLSSHTNARAASEIAHMIQHLRQHCYNVAGVFFSNGFNADAKRITLLPWNELLWIENPPLKGAESIAQQLDNLAKEFSEFIIDRARLQ